MASRIDSLQIAVPRSVDAQQQQHVARRMPVVAQELAAAAGRREAEIREERTEALDHSTGQTVHQRAVPGLEDDNGDAHPGSRRGRAGGRRSSRHPALPAAAPAAGRPVPPHLDGKGSRIDLAL